MASAEALGGLADFFNVPPFPRARPRPLLQAESAPIEINDSKLDELLRRMCELKVGGSYWGAQPQLPHSTYTVIHSKTHPIQTDISAQLKPESPMVCSQNWSTPLDPWHLMKGASEAIIDADDELVVIGRLAGVSVKTIGEGRFRLLESGGTEALRDAFRPLASVRFISPFDDETLDFEEVIELCGFWRKLIDENRDLAAAIGFARWKRKTVEPLLWGGSNVRFRHSWRLPEGGSPVAVWKSRADWPTLERLNRNGTKIVEVEDGFIRSVGLGAECIPPLSIVVDRLGIYFDPNRPSDLEQLLQQENITADMCARAKRLRQLIVELGISKYGAGARKLERRGPKQHLLVVGQVEDDRAVIEGLGPATNLELLRMAREENPRSYVIYKPHPDVEAGHRTGAIADKECLRLADEIVRDVPISSLIDLVDEIHVNTSLAGFEALLRGKEVITYGVPFYAGWGLTRDLGPVPNRRNTKRNIDELVAAALLLYPRYLDPVTGLPCPPEILVRRIGEGSPPQKPTQLVRLRRLQGKWKRSLAVFRPNR